MRIDVATLFPEMFRSVLDASILGLARRSGRLDVGLFDIRDFTTSRSRVVDAKPYGGGPGMLLQVEPVVRCVETILRERGEGRVILLTPQGRRFDQSYARELADPDAHVVLVCGRYEGFDERVRSLLNPEELSIGDFVLTGGELPAMTVIDAVARLLPGVLGDEQSAVTESFSDGKQLEGPQYTRPREFRGRSVPDVLLSGDHERIATWRAVESRKRTEEAAWPHDGDRSKRTGSGDTTGGAT